MDLVFHPSVYSDIDKILEYYEHVASRELADEFYAELRHFMQETVERSESFSIRQGDTADTALRLSRFFGNSASFWLGLQMDYDLDVAAHHGSTKKSSNWPLPE